MGNGLKSATVPRYAHETQQMWTSGIHICHVPLVVIEPDEHATINRSTGYGNGVILGRGSDLG